MAKGLGAIMAAQKQTAARWRIEEGISIACPVCGAEMEYNGSVWVCRGIEANMPSDLRAAAEAAGFDPLAFYVKDGAIDALAAVVDEEEEIRVYLIPANKNGRFGGWVVTVADIDEKGREPELIAKFGWTWADWVPNRFVEEIKEE